MPELESQTQIIVVMEPDLSHTLIITIYIETQKKRIIGFMMVRHFIPKIYLKLKDTYLIMQHFFNKKREQKIEHRFR